MSASEKQTWITIERLRRLAVALSLAGVAGLLFDAWSHLHGGSLVDANGDLIGRDFGNFWSGANLAAMGKSATVYDIPTYEAFQKAIIDPGVGPKWYAYPPTTLLISLPLSLINFLPGLVAWQLFGSLLCAWIIARQIGSKWALLSVAGTPAAFLNAYTGQNGCYTAALFASGIIALGKQPILAGVLFGTLVFKPQFLILIPVALVAGRRWHALASMTTTVIVLVALSFALFGGDTWTAFRHVSPLNLFILQTRAINYHIMPTIYVMMRTLGFSSALGFTAQALAGLTATYIVYRTWQSSAPLLLKGCALIFGTFLVTPYAWDYDLIVVTFALVFFLKSVRAETLSEFEKLFGVILFLSPFLTLLVFTGIGIQIGPILFFVALIVAAKHASRPMPDSALVPAG